MITNSFIDVRSISLIRQLKEKRLLKYLTIVKKEEVNIDGKICLYPFWLFKNNYEVKNVYDKFVQEFRDDNRSLDKDLWDKYNPEILNFNKESKFIKSHGYAVLDRVIDENLIFYLLFADDEAGRKRFKFAYCDRIEEIKREEAIKSDLIYSARNKRT